MSKSKPEEYEYVEVEVDEEEEEEEEDDKLEELDEDPNAKLIGKHSKKEKKITSFGDLETFNRNKQKLQEEAKARGADVSLTIVFPDKKTHIIKVPLNQTVEYVKSIIETKYGIDYSKMTLTLDGKTMIDPFSLSDYPAITPKGKNVITLTVS